MNNQATKMAVATMMAMACAAVAQAETGTLRVFILAGQSNMVGHGKVETGRNPNHDPDDKTTHAEVEAGIGSLRWLVGRDPEKYGATGTMPLLDAEGQWRVREDVLIHCTVDQQVKKGRLSTRFGKGQWFGPELGFGHVVGDAVDEPVLIIKTAWGGKSLAIDFRPPSAGPYQFPEEVVERWRNNPGRHGVPNDVDQHLADTASARTTFEVDDKDAFDALRLRMWVFRQQDIEVYLNGTPVAKINQASNNQWLNSPLTEGALRALRNGTNTIAVTSRNNWRWGSYFRHYETAFDSSVLNGGVSVLLDGRAGEGAP